MTPVSRLRVARTNARIKTITTITTTGKNTEYELSDTFLTTFQQKGGDSRVTLRLLLMVVFKIFREKKALEAEAVTAIEVADASAEGTASLTVTAKAAMNKGWR